MALGLLPGLLLSATTGCGDDGSCARALAASQSAVSTANVRRQAAAATSELTTTVDQAKNKINEAQTDVTSAQDAAKAAKGRADQATQQHAKDSLADARKAVKAANEAVEAVVGTAKAAVDLVTKAAPDAAEEAENTKKALEKAQKSLGTATTAINNNAGQMAAAKQAIDTAVQDIETAATAAKKAAEAAEQAASDADATVTSGASKAAGACSEPEPPSGFPTLIILLLVASTGGVFLYFLWSRRAGPVPAQGSAPRIWRPDLRSAVNQPFASPTGPSMAGPPAGGESASPAAGGRETAGLAAMVNALRQVARSGISPAITQQIDRLLAGQSAPGRTTLVRACVKYRDQFEGKGAPLRQVLVDALATAGITEITADGEQFDPVIHEAVDTVGTPDPSQHDLIAETIRCGYTDGDRVLRLPKVVVFRATGASGADGPPPAGSR